MNHQNKTSAMDMSLLQKEIRRFNGFAWPSRLGQEQKQRERQIRAAAKLFTIPEDTVADEDMKQLAGPPAMFFTKRAHPNIHFTLYNKGPNFPRDIKSFNPKIIQIPVVPGTTYAEIIAAAQVRAGRAHPPLAFCRGNAISIPDPSLITRCWSKSRKNLCKQRTLEEGLRRR